MNGGSDVGRKVQSKKPSRIRCDGEEATAADDRKTSLTSTPTSLLDEERQRLLEQANAGDEAAFNTLREALPPGALDAVLTEMGELASRTRRALVRLSAGDSELEQKAVESAAQELRSRLAGNGASALERLLIERIVCCWIDVNITDRRFLVKNGQTYVPSQFVLYQRVRDRSHHRFLSACKALAQVRKLLGGNVQINIGEKQINLSGGALAEMAQQVEPSGRSKRKNKR